MKKAQYAQPNQHLKQQRELRGWSQSDVARYIGVDHFYISRWERGLTVPSPYYRQKLCALFGKNTEELGLLQHQPLQGQTEAAAAASSSSLPLSAAVIAALATSLIPAKVVEDPAIPSLSTTRLVGRDRLVAELRQTLCAEVKGRAVALCGLPGVGKTTLAATLVHDPETAEHFADGVLWAGLGPQPDVLGLLSRWGALLGISEAEARNLTSPEQWIRTLRAVIGSRYLLVVIDDSWRIEDALAFKISSSNCAYVLTTRFPPLAFQFTSMGTFTVGELATDEGVALLTDLAPEVVATDPDSTRLLVHAVGGLPLALTIIGNYLRTQSYGNQPRRIHAALVRLQDAEERLWLERHSPPAEPSSPLPSGSPVSLHSIIAVSEQQLNEPARQALRSLSIFPAKPNTFSEEAAIAIAACPATVLDELSDAGLLENSEPGRYTLHQVIADYASTYSADHEAPVRMMTYIAGYVAAHGTEHEMLSQESKNIIAALRIMTQNQDHRAQLVRCIIDFAPFLVQSGLYQQAEEFLRSAELAARALPDEAGLAAILCQLAEIYFEWGKFGEVREMIQEGLVLARKEQAHKYICRSLDLLAALSRGAGDYQQAQTFYDEGLAIARRADDPAEICDLLMGIGGNKCEQGLYNEAEDYLREGIALARRTDDYAAVCGLLVNSSQAVIMRGDTIQGDAYSLEALQIARQLGYLKVIGVTLSNLGATASDRGDYAQAESYMLESLRLARQMEQPDSICINTANLGDNALKQGNVVEAEKYLSEALDLARHLDRRVLLNDVLELWGELQLKLRNLDLAEAAFREIKEAEVAGSQVQEAVGCYGLARVLLERGEEAESRMLAEQSIRTFKSCGDRRIALVEAWYQEHFV